MIEIYTDGSCLSNPGGASGWAFIILLDGKEVCSSHGGTNSSTNNRMEITAVLESLKKLGDEKGDICIYTDSQYVLNCAQKLWKRNLNTDLWEMYDNLSFGKKISFKWVKAHNGNLYNERVDQLAKSSAEQYVVSV